MKLRMLVVMATGLVTVAAVAQEDAGKLQGKWKLVRYERAGEQKPLLKNDVASLSADKLTFPALGKNLGYKIDPTKAPKQIDLTNAGTNRRQVWSGIYELEGDTLKLCVATGSDQTRPQQFTTKGTDSARMYFIFERLKP
jgi:uncharacterized protein (TIGR03067 family)